MLGIDVERAQSLVDELQNWSATTAQAAELVAAAEALSQLTTGVHPLLDQLGAKGRGLARSIDTAVTRLLAHETKVAAAFDGLIPQGGFWATGVGFDGARVTTKAGRAHLAERVAARIRNALDQDRAPNGRDYAALRSIFASATDDAKTADAAMGFALRGLPAAVALEVTRPEQVTETFDRVNRAMQAGV